MDYKEFVEQATTGVKDRLGAAYWVDFIPVKRNNGILADAICVGNKEEHIRVNVYVEEFYEDYLAHEDLEKSVSEIIAFIEEHHIPKEQAEDMRQVLGDWMGLRDMSIQRYCQERRIRSCWKIYPVVHFWILLSYISFISHRRSGMVL